MPKIGISGFFFFVTFIKFNNCNYERKAKFFNFFLHYVKIEVKKAIFFGLKTSKLGEI